MPVLESSADLSSWSPMIQGLHFNIANDAFLGLQRVQSLTLLPAAAPPRFFRVRFPER